MGVFLEISLVLALLMANSSKKPGKKAGLRKYLIFYWARHGFGTEMYGATKNLFAVMNVMGTHRREHDDEVSSPEH